MSSQSTISRFACRILANRDENDLSARIYAAGFDSSRNIFLGKQFYTRFWTFIGWSFPQTANRILVSIISAFVGEKATKWETQDPRESCVDGLTTNGVLVMSPNGVFCPGDSQLITSDSQNQDNNGKKSVSPAKPGLWREISVIRLINHSKRVS